MPAVPLQRAFPELFLRYLHAALPHETFDYLQVALLVRGGEGDSQTEASGERELLLHGVAGMYVVVQLTPVGEVLPDQIAPVGGSVEPDVLRRLLDAAFQAEP